MKAAATLTALLLCGLATAAHAETTLSLKQRCTGMTGIANASMCRSSVNAVVGTLKDNPAYCIAKDADGAANLKLVQAFLLAHPEDGKLPSDEVIGKAMAEAYPCPAKP